MGYKYGAFWNLLSSRQFYLLVCMFTLFLHYELIRNPNFTLTRSTPAQNDCSNPLRLPPTSYHLLKSPCLRKEFFGDEAYGGWTACYPEGGLEAKTIYTIGVGTNINWDQEMIAKYGTVHHGWDPTPTAERFFAKAGPPKGFTFHKLGLGIKDGTVTVKLPVGHGASWTVEEYQKDAQEGKIVEIQVRTLKTLLKVARVKSMAILKIDVEGVEFDVIESWWREGYRPPAQQILVEFHQRFFEKSRADWKQMVSKAVGRMESLGFGLIHARKNDYSFIKSACAGQWRDAADAQNVKG